MSQEADESGDANHDCEALSVGCWCVSAECGVLMVWEGNTDDWRQVFINFVFLNFYDVN